MILSITNLQEDYAKALLVDREALTDRAPLGRRPRSPEFSWTLIHRRASPVRQVAKTWSFAGPGVPRSGRAGNGEVTEERKEGAGAGWLANSNKLSGVSSR